MLSYIDFVITSKRPYLEAEGDKSGARSMPIPPMVMGVLRNAPVAHDSVHYVAILRWIYGEGLYYASAKRKRLTDLANKELAGVLPKGVKLREFDMYSKESHQHYGKPLIDFYNKYYVEHPENYEPPFIDLSSVSGGNTIKLNIAKLNKQIEAEGTPIFRYGGEEGLIEFIESGRDDKGNQWAERKYPKSRFSSNPHEDRIGLSVSNPNVHLDENGDNTYTFSDFNPNKTNRWWNRLATGIIKYGDQQVRKEKMNIERRKLGQPEERIDHAYAHDKEAFDRFVNDPNLTEKPFAVPGSHMSVPSKWEFANEKNAIRDFVKEEGGSEKFPIVAFLINLAMNELIAEKGTRLPAEAPQAEASHNEAHKPPVRKYPQDPETMLTRGGGIFRNTADPDAMQIDPRYSPNKEAPAGNQPTTDPLIARGAEIAQEIFKSGGWEALEKEIVAFTTGRSPTCRLLGGWKPPADPQTIKDALEDEILNYEPTNKMNVHGIPAKPGDYDFASYIRKGEGEKEPLTPGDLEIYRKNGFKLVVNDKLGRPKVEEGDLPRNAKEARLVNNAQRQKFNLRNEGGQWYIINPPNPSTAEELPIGREVGKSQSVFDKSSKHWLGGRHHIRTNVGDAEEISFRHPNAWRELDDRMRNDPQSYGYELGGSPNTYDDFLKMGAAYAIRNLRSNKKLSDVQVQRLDDTTPENMQHQIAQGMARFADSNEFRVGDLNDPKLPKLIKSQAGVEDDDAIRGVIDHVRQLLASGADADEVRQDLDNDAIFNALAINGKMWRLKKCVASAMKSILAPEAMGDTDAGDEDMPSGGGGAAGASISNSWSYGSGNKADAPKEVWDDKLKKWVPFTPNEEEDDEGDLLNKSVERSDTRGAQLAGRSAPVGPSDETPDEARARLATELESKNTDKPFWKIGTTYYNVNNKPNKGKYLNVYDAVENHLKRLGNSGLGAAKIALQKITPDKTPENDAAVLAVADYVRKHIDEMTPEDYQPGVEDFVNPKGANYLGKFTNNLITPEAIGELKTQLDAIRVERHGNLSLVNHPSIQLGADYINNPADLEKEYRKALGSNDISTINYIANQINKSGDNDYKKILLIPNPNLRPTADQLRSTPLTPSLSISPTTAPTTPPATTPTTPTTPTTAPLSFRAILDKKRTPPTMSKESTMVDYARFKVSKLRRSLLEMYSRRSGRCR